MAEPLTQAQVAEIVGVTTRRLQQMDKEDGAPPRTASSGYPCKELGEWLAQRIATKLGVTSDGVRYDYEAERGRLTHAQADKTELEVKELRGELLRREIVLSHWAAMIGAMRNRLLAVPAKAAPGVIAAKNLPEVQEAIRVLVYEALEEIAGDGFPHEVAKRIDGPTAGGEAPAESDAHGVGGSAPKAKQRKQRGARKVAH